MKVELQGYLLRCLVAFMILFTSVCGIAQAQTQTSPELSPFVAAMGKHFEIAKEHVDLIKARFKPGSKEYGQATKRYMATRADFQALLKTLEIDLESKRSISTTKTYDEMLAAAEKSNRAFATYVDNATQSKGAWDLVPFEQVGKWIAELFKDDIRTKILEEVRQLQSKWKPFNVLT